jgi:hypothetical protein
MRHMLALILEKKLSMIILEPKKYGDKKYAKEDGEGIARFSLVLTPL